LGKFGKYYKSCSKNPRESSSAYIPFEFNPALGLGILGGWWAIRQAFKNKNI